ncbi:MAG: glycoside hydrolase family 88 protein [Anaerolineales bacterium]|nr:glycoside hydrolase family 88 protein [Anaerolineales bacterium]MDW8161302.1 glycoside hydrolase family 88 protein [Anaerolineales bacterium]
MSSIPPEFHRVVEIARQKLLRLVTEYPDLMPSFTENGKWRLQQPGWTNWCEGFLGGALWLIYLLTEEARFRQHAEHYSRLIEERKTDRTVHDLGFLFLPTWGRWYRLDGNSYAREVLIEAGRTLAGRYQAAGRYLCSFQGVHSLYIDIMMNVPLVFEAAQLSGEERLLRIAREHCHTTRRYLVRGDFSTAHEGIFDPESGRFICYQTQQGWRSDSTWVRGHCWALYGFTLAFRYTREAAFLSTAQGLADYYLLHTPEHGIPPNDWDEPNPKYPYESSAAAIAASGLLSLADCTTDMLRAKVYREAAQRILSTLCSDEFLAIDPQWEGILRHAIYHFPAEVGVDESTIWGDYFFLEAIGKISQVLPPEC